MKHSRIKASVAALAVAALIGLSACGGGSDGLSKMEEETLQTERDAAVEAAQKAAEAAEAARMAAEEAERQRQAEQEAREKAEAEAAEAERKRQAEQEAREAADRERLEAEREAERERQAAEQAAREAERAREAAEAEAERARQEAQRRIEEAARQADVAVRAPLLRAALAGVTATNQATSMSVRHMRGEGRTFTRPNNLPAKGSAPSVPGSWSSASYSGPRGAVGTDTVYLYTNIQAPSSKAFWKVHGEEVTSITAADATVSGFGTQAKELYPAADGTLDGTGTTSGSDKGRSIGGTYQGYSGTFKCDADCDIAAVDGGALTFHGTWTFTAGLTAKKSSRYAEQDSEFLYFGIWAFEPAVAAGTPEFMWAAGGDVTAITNFDALEGEAMFTGGAIGKYALASATGRGARAAKTGAFTATATFTADFTADTLSGRITDFKEGGSSLGADWNIFLGSSASAPATLAAAGAGATADGVAGAIDGDNVTAGAWNATLHGSDNPGASILHAADAAKYPASRYPVADVAGVAGWFSAAAGTDAAIAGAFGAACTTGTMCAK